MSAFLRTEKTMTESAEGILLVISVTLKKKDSGSSTATVTSSMSHSALGASSLMQEDREIITAGMHRKVKQFDKVFILVLNFGDAKIHLFKLTSKDFCPENLYNKNVSVYNSFVLNIDNK